MDTNSLIEIARGLDHVKFVQLPVFQHMYFDEWGKLHSTATNVDNAKFKHFSFIEYLINEKKKGNTVYILEGSANTMYDPNNFDPYIAIRLKSINGTCSLRDKVVDKTEPINEAPSFDNNKFRYLVIR